MRLEVKVLITAAEDDPDLKKKIIQVKVTFPDYFGMRVRSLLTRCFEYDPLLRITIDGILDSPWMLKYKNLI